MVLTNSFAPSSLGRSGGTRSAEPFSLAVLLAGGLHPARITTGPLLAAGRVLDRLARHVFRCLAVQYSKHFERLADVDADAVHLVLARPPRGMAAGGEVVGGEVRERVLGGLEPFIQVGHGPTLASPPAPVHVARPLETSARRASSYAPSSLCSPGEALSRGSKNTERGSAG